MKYLKILEYGKFYFPAWKHYGDSRADVVCDKCLKPNLSACIGYNDQDLCLSCVDEIANYECNEPMGPSKTQIPFIPMIPKFPIKHPFIKPPMIEPLYVPQLEPDTEPCFEPCCDSHIEPCFKKSKENCVNLSQNKICNKSKCDCNSDSE